MPYSYRFIQYSYRLITGILLLGLISACATSLYDQASYSAFITNSTIETAHFKHRIYFKEQALTESAEQSNGAVRPRRKLSIFIEGDGTPWIREKYVAKDPTPQILLLFDAMQELRGSKLYIGRPCYFQTKDPNCHYRYWTSHRYSAEVIQSMQDVLERYIERYDEIVYIGHSGGGTLATLLACKPPAEHIISTTLVTLSANLDTDKWTDHHGWTRMSGSINPALSLTKCPHVRQFHYLGKEDLNVLHVLNQHYYAQHGIKPILYETADHSNWLRFWPEIVKTNPALKASEQP